MSTQTTTSLPMVIDSGDQLLSKEFIDTLNIWYEEAHGFHVWNGTKYVEMNEGALKAYLKTLNIRSSARGGASQMDHALTDIRMRKSVAYVGSLAGKSAGIHEENGQRILILGGPTIIRPDATADWSLLREFIEDLLAPEKGRQIPHFYGWLKVAIEALENNSYAPGQAIALAGARECGKTLLQTMIAELLGGRTANPYAYLSGGTPFNRDLFRAETLVFGDEIGSTDIRVRRGIGSRLKQMTVNQDQYCHGKGREAVTLRPQWRVCLSLNDETENLMVLPPIDASIEDKLMLLRTRRPKLFDDPVKWENNRSKDWVKIRKGLPGLVAYLHQFQIPRDIQNGRFGVKAYHDPDLMLALHSIAPEARLIDIIDMSDLFNSPVTKLVPGEKIKSQKRDFWEGGSLDLEKFLLRDDADRTIRESTGRLLTFNSAMGTYLGRLEKKTCRVSSKRVNGQTIWCIHKPRGLEDGG